MSASASSPLPRRDDFRSVLAMTVWSALTLIAVVLISRRLGGAYRARLGAAAPCLAATASFLLSVAAHALWCAAHPTASVRKHVLAAGVTLVPPLAIAAALWNSPSALIGGYLAVLSALSAVATLMIHDVSAGTARPPQWQSPPQSQSPLQRQSIVMPPGPAAGSSPAARPVEANASLLDEPLDEGPLDEGPSGTERLEEAGEGDASILQWMTRRQLPDGAETVEGSVRIHFAAGERSAVAHVSFIPPLSERPRAECQVLADFEGRVRIGVAQSYGLRIEARRPESATQAASIDVGFSACVRAAQSAAA